MTFLMKDKRAPAKASIRYAPAEDGTEVTWSMEGDLASMMPPVLRGLMKPMMSGMIGKNIAKGLESLKAKVEAA
jgi:carbon monoxide dehydrogenase subunit G